MMFLSSENYKKIKNEYIKNLVKCFNKNYICKLCNIRAYAEYYRIVRNIVQLLLKIDKNISYI